MITAMSGDRAIHIVGRLLLLLQAGLIAFCIHHIIDAYVTPYVSEWLTAEAFVPFGIALMFFYGLCMLLTWRSMRSKHRFAWIPLLALAVVTLLPYVGLLKEYIALG